MTKLNQTMYLENPINDRKSILDAINQGLDNLAQWHHNLQMRRQLQGLSDEMLQDIGLNWGDIQQEVSRWFWEPIDYCGLEQKRSLNIRQSWMTRQ